MVRILHDLMTRNGFQTSHAKNGETGLAEAFQNTPDLILLDIMMPGMDGFEVCHRLKQNPTTRDVPVIFLSALADIVDKLKAFSEGGVDYILKPFHIEEVMIRVKTHLTIRLLQKSLQEKNRMLMQEIEERQRIQEQLERIAIIDPLTGLYNRRHFFTVSLNEFKKSRRYNRPLSVILLDADHFKNVNDTYGHAVGDLALIHLAQIMKTNLRVVDILARYGGEEFIILLPETNLPDTLTVAERICNEVASTPLIHEDKSVHLTVSMGVADILSCGIDCTFDTILINADKALYAAKDAGRNQVAAFS